MKITISNGTVILRLSERNLKALAQTMIEGGRPHLHTMDHSSGKYLVVEVEKDSDHYEGDKPSRIIGDRSVREKAARFDKANEIKGDK